MGDEHVPKGFLDLKGETLKAFNVTYDGLKSGRLEEVSLSNDANVIVITDFAAISADAISLAGELDVNHEDQQEKAFNAITKGTIQARNQVVEKWGENKQIINRSELFILKTVEIIPHANPDAAFTLDRMLLFSDKIAGLTFAARRDQNQDY
jgi:hypothetical protein